MRTLETCGLVPQRASRSHAMVESAQEQRTSRSFWRLCFDSAGAGIRLTRIAWDANRLQWQQHNRLVGQPGRHEC